jgi:hypothetical protein
VAGNQKRLNECAELQSAISKQVNPCLFASSGSVTKKKQKCVGLFQFKRAVQGDVPTADILLSRLTFRTLGRKIMPL